MAGTVTQTHERQGPVGVVTLSFTADDSDGSVPDTVITTRISGKLLSLETNPGATAPTANYDITVDDADGKDVLEGVGANRHTSTTEKVAIAVDAGDTLFNPPIAFSDILTFKLANNSVNSAVGTVKLYYEGVGVPA